MVRHGDDVIEENVKWQMSHKMRDTKCHVTRQ